MGLTLVTRPAWCLVALAVLLVVWWQAWTIAALEQRAIVAELAPSRTAWVRTAAAADTASRKLDTVIQRVRVVVDRVRVDTFMLAPSTPADTARAVAQLPTLVVAHDSLQRSCSALVISCDAFRRTATIAADSARRHIADLERALKSATGPRCGWRCGALLGVGAALLAKPTADVVTSSIRSLLH